MLRKLIKYDLLYGYKLFLGCTVITMLYALLGPEMKLDHLHMLLQILLIFLPMVVPFVCVVLVIRLYATSLYGPQGYLTLTLPVRPVNILLSKMITAIIWFNVILAAAGISLVFMLNYQLGDLLQGDVPVMVTVVVVTSNVLMLNILQGVYMAITISYTALKKIPRFVGVVGSLGTVGMIESFAGKLLWTVNKTSAFVKTFGYEGETLRSGGYRMINPLSPPEDVSGWSQLTDINLLILAALFAVLLFVGNHYLVKRKVNLD